MADFASIRFVPERPLLRELSADRLNSILAEIKRNKPKGERGITVRQDGNQTWIGLAASLPRGGGAAADPHPFKLLSASGEDPEAVYARVVYGTVNSIAPTGMSVGDDPPYIIELTEPLGYIYLGATIDALTTEITSLWIDQGQEIPSDEEEEFETYFEIGSYVVEDGNVTFAQSATSSLAYVRVGYLHIWGQS